MNKSQYVLFSLFLKWLSYEFSRIWIWISLVMIKWFFLILKKKKNCKLSQYLFRTYIFVIPVTKKWELKNDYVSFVTFFLLIKWKNFYNYDIRLIIFLRHYFWFKKLLLEQEKPAVHLWKNYIAVCNLINCCCVCMVIFNKPICLISCIYFIAP